MQDFTGEAAQAPSSKRATIGDGSFDERIRKLVQDYECHTTPHLIEEMVMTALTIGREAMNTADVKMINRALKELRQAARVFAPFTHFRKVAVFGSARTSPLAPEFQAAEDFSRMMREEGYMIITGGGDGIMGAAQRGAGRENSFGLNIKLPFEQQANETIHGDSKLVDFHYFFTRKINFLKETHAVALFPGGFGTMDEGFECLTLMQTGKARIVPLVVIDTPQGNFWETWNRFLRDELLVDGLISPDDFSFFKITHSLEEAVREITGFYRYYHSFRYVNELKVIRLNEPLIQRKVDRLNAEFSDLLITGKFVQGVALRQERNEPNILHLPRLIFTPHRRNFGRMRQLINAINADD